MHGADNITKRVTQHNFPAKFIYTLQPRSCSFPLRKATKPQESKACITR